MRIKSHSVRFSSNLLQQNVKYWSVFKRITTVVFDPVYAYTSINVMWKYIATTAFDIFTVEKAQV